MKKKSLAALLSGLLTVSLTGVGFASWVVLEGANTTVSGNITIETVDRKLVSLVATPATGSNIHFGKPTSGGTTGWLRNTDGTAESLSFDLTLKVKNASIINDDGIVFTFEDGGDKFDTASAEGTDLVTGPTYYLVDGETETKITNGVFTDYEDVDTEQTFTIRIKFGWGSHFEGQNPYNWYNSDGKTSSGTSTKATSKTWATDAYDSLKALEALNNETFNFTITAEV